MKEFLEKLYEEKEDTDEKENSLDEEKEELGLFAFVPSTGGININEGGNGRSQEEENIIAARKEGKRKMEETIGEREARKLKEAARTLQKMKMGGSSSVRKKRATKRATLKQRRRSNRVLEVRFAPNYCETKRRRSKEKELTDLYSSSGTRMDEETEVTKYSEDEGSIDMEVHKIIEDELEEARKNKMEGEDAERQEEEKKEEETEQERAESEDQQEQEGFYMDLDLEEESEEPLAENQTTFETQTEKDPSEPSFQDEQNSEPNANVQQKDYADSTGPHKTSSDQISTKLCYSCWSSKALSMINDPSLMTNLPEIYFREMGRPKLPIQCSLCLTTTEFFTTGDEEHRQWSIWVEERASNNPNQPTQLLPWTSQPNPILIPQSQVQTHTSSTPIPQANLEQLRETKSQVAVQTSTSIIAPLPPPSPPHSNSITLDPATFFEDPVLLEANIPPTTSLPSPVSPPPATATHIPPTFPAGFPTDQRVRQLETDVARLTGRVDRGLQTLQSQINTILQLLLSRTPNPPPS